MSKLWKYFELVEQDKRAKEEIRREKTFEEFKKKTDYKHILNQIKQSNHLRNAQENQKLEDRRNKLRKILTEDAKNFSREYEQKSEFFTKTRFENMEKKATALKLNRLRQEEASASQKILQKIKDNSEEMRILMTRQNLLHVKRAQLLQIEEKKTKKQREKQLESMWNEYAANIKTFERNRIEGEKNNSKQTVEMIRKQLLKQIEMKKRILEQEQWIKELEREECTKAREEEEMERKKVHEEKMKKMLRQKQMYDELLKQKHEMEESKQRELMELQRQHNKEIEEEMQKEMEEKIKYKMQMKLETELFLKYLENVRKERENLNSLFEQSKKQEEMRLTQKKEEEQKRFEEARKKLNKRVLEVREKQVEDIKKQEIYERELKMIEREMLNAERRRLKQLEEEETRRHRERAIKYFMDITNQVEEKKQLEEKKRLMDIQEYEKGRQEEEALRKTVQELLNETTKF